MAGSFQRASEDIYLLSLSDYPSHASSSAPAGSLSLSLSLSLPLSLSLSVSLSLSPSPSLSPSASESYDSEESSETNYKVVHGRPSSDWPAGVFGLVEGADWLLSGRDE